MGKKLSRREIIKKSIKGGLAIGGAALVGSFIYGLFREYSIEDLYGSYPPDSDSKPLKVVNPNAPKPNIIIIYCDDLGYGDLGCFGSKAIQTPNIDRLARDGKRFTDYHACNAICAPSRAGLLTGRYPFRSGIIGNTYPRNEPTTKRLARRFGSMLRGLGSLDLREDYVARGISPQEITLAEALKTAGYRTGMIGKWHLGDYSKDPQFNPCRHGFDEYFGVPYSNDMFPLPLFRNEKQLEEDMGLNQARITGMYTKEALEFIERSKGGPFFLYLAHTFPHQPLFASERFKNRSMAGKFGDAVEEIDWSVGEIVSQLRKYNLDKNTIIVFTSDNGPWFEGNTGTLRGRKGQSYEGGFKVPFIAKWPGHIPAGTVCHEPMINLDLFPTLLSLAGVELPPDRIIDGKDIKGLLTGTMKKSPHDEIFFFHFDLLEGVRSGRWKYFRKINRYVWPVPMDTAVVPDTLGKKQLGNRWPLLYDLKMDSGESYNVINKYPNIAEKLLKKITDMEAAMEKNPRGFFAK